MRIAPTHARLLSVGHRVYQQFSLLFNYIMGFIPLNKIYAGVRVLFYKVTELAFTFI